MVANSIRVIPSRPAFSFEDLQEGFSASAILLGLNGQRQSDATIRENESDRYPTSNDKLTGLAQRNDRSRLG